MLLPRQHKCLKPNIVLCHQLGMLHMGVSDPFNSSESSWFILIAVIEGSTGIRSIVALGGLTHK